MDYCHHKSGSKKRQEKIIREGIAKRGQKSFSSFFVPGGEHPTITNDAVMAEGVCPIPWNTRTLGSLERHY